MKRFYQQVTVAEREGGHAILLDGKQIKTPAGRPLAAPTRALAEAVAAEWRAQGERVRPLTMPLTQLLNTALDRMEEPRVRAGAVAEIAAYFETDLVCFRAEHPRTLAARQAAAWQPLVDWITERYGARLAVTGSLAPPRHPPEALGHLAEAIGSADRMRLAALHVAAAALGSAVIALALAEGRLDADSAFRAAYLDDLHQMEVWGEDAEARARLDRIRTEIASVAEFLRLAAA
jgi:chaperone required for assembly of F1-ATPase